MAYDDDEVRRLRKKEQSRFGKRARPDPDVIAERRTREKMVEELLNLKTEDEYRREFLEVMKSYGLQVGPSDLERALTLWRSRH
jgi:hypothetical protein